MRPLEEIKTDPRLCAFGVKGHGAITHACIDFMHKGQHELQAKHEAQAKTLRDALAIIEEHREYLSHNLAGRMIDIPHPGENFPPSFGLGNSDNAWAVIRTFGTVVMDYVEWLEHPHNIDYTERNNRSYMTFLGRHWRRYGLDEHPGIQALREIHIIVMGRDAPQEDADVLKAFRSGWQVSKENA